MAVAVQVLGAGQLGRVATALRLAGQGGLSRELDRALRRAGGHVIRAVELRTDDYMPKGYERTFSMSLRLRPQVRLAYDARVSIVASAQGKIRPREIRRLEAGTIRHPVFGRWRMRRGKHAGKHAIRNPWVTQKIRPHFFTEPANAAAPLARQEMLEAIRRTDMKIKEAT